MLTQKEREWVLTERNRYTKKDTTTKRVRDYKIRKKARKMLEDLTFLAGALSSNQHKQIFNVESLKPFVDALGEYASAHASRERDKEKRAITYDATLFKMGVLLGNEFLTIASLLMGERYRKGVTIQILPPKERIDDLNIIYNALKVAEAKK